MKITLRITVIVSLLINLSFCYVFLIKGNTIPSNDHRITLKMSEDNRDFVLLEMREFLESVQQINKGILDKNAQALIDAGTTSGGSVIAHAPKGLLKSLPIGFKKLGFDTHDIFDQIKNTAQNDFNPITAQQQLDMLLTNCIACHKTYKISSQIQELK